MYSIWTLLAYPEYAQKIVLRDYLRSMAATVASDAYAMEFEPVVNRTRIMELREHRDWLRRCAWEVTL